MKIVSLLPSATEIICALGLKDSLVAVSHECDYPAGVSDLPHITSSILGQNLNPKQIDDAVINAVQQGKALYQIDGDLLAELQPDLIITQGLCDVCAVNQDTLDATLKFLPDVITDTRVLTLSATTFEGVLHDMSLVAQATNTLSEFEVLATSLRAKWQTIASNQPEAKPNVLMLEWSEPPFYAGHWVPEMVEVAGGVDLMGSVGAISKRTTWQAIADLNPDLICLVACGFDKAKNTEFAAELKSHPEASQLQAVKQDKVFAFDANSYFSRPAPRIVEGAEQLQQIFRSFSD